MLRVYGSRISYYTGKLEAYLRYRGIEYALLPTEPHRRELHAGAGTVQMPIVRLEDDRWMSDSTPILAWLDPRQGAPSIYPTDPAMRFVALLLEDHADEWLWRPAMHMRWSHRLDRDHASGLLADELLEHLRMPRFLKRRMLVRRQHGGFVAGDGVTPRTRAHVEASILHAFEGLEAVLARRRFLLGDRPSVADFGFMGPMFRHLAQDPTPADWMRARAPGVYAWVGRMWNARAEAGAGELLAEPDPPVVALLVEACETHLVQLRENAHAFARGRSRYDQTIQGCRYAAIPASRYRVWCLERLREDWAALDEAARARLRAALPEREASVLWRDDAVPVASGYDPERRAPFNRAINVFGRGVPA
ncbi:MAG: glutathione S-transferase family protein [Myxococcota bacterium]